MLGDPIGPAIRKLTRVNQECETFLSKNSEKQFFGRYVNTKSYTKIGDNLGECVVQLSDKKIVLSEVYVSIKNESYALVWFFENVDEIFLSEAEVSYCLLYQVSKLENLL